MEILVYVIYGFAVLYLGGHIGRSLALSFTMRDSPAFYLTKWTVDKAGTVGLVLSGFVPVLIDLVMLPMVITVVEDKEKQKLQENLYLLKKRIGLCDLALNQHYQKLSFLIRDLAALKVQHVQLREDSENIRTLEAKIISSNEIFKWINSLIEESAEFLVQENVVGNPEIEEWVENVIDNKTVPMITDVAVDEILTRVPGMIKSEMEYYSDNLEEEITGVVETLLPETLDEEEIERIVSDKFANLDKNYSKRIAQYLNMHLKGNLYTSEILVGKMRLFLERMSDTRTLEHRMFIDILEKAIFELYNISTVPANSPNPPPKKREKSQAPTVKISRIALDNS